MEFLRRKIRCKKAGPEETLSPYFALVFSGSLPSILGQYGEWHINWEKVTRKHFAKITPFFPSENFFMLFNVKAI